MEKKDTSWTTISSTPLIESFIVCQDNLDLATLHIKRKYRRKEDSMASF
jgi:hypothetical protein